ncbi:MAG: DUF5592 family protein [Coprococcus sp.]
MRYLVTKEIKSETQVIWKLYLQDFVFLSVWIFLCLNLQENVHKYLEIPYLIFSGIVGICLMIPALGNPKRRTYQALALYLLKPKKVIGFRKKEKKHEEETGTRDYRYQGRYSNTKI